VVTEIAEECVALADRVARGAARLAGEEGEPGLLLAGERLALAAIAPPSKREAPETSVRSYAAIAWPSVSPVRPRPGNAASNCCA